MMADKTKLEAALAGVLGDDWDSPSGGLWGQGGRADLAEKAVKGDPTIKDLVQELAEDPSFDWLFSGWESLVIAVDPGLFKHAPAYTKGAGGVNNYLVELLTLYYTGPDNRNWVEHIASSEALQSVVDEIDTMSIEEIRALLAEFGFRAEDPIGHPDDADINTGMKTLFGNLQMSDDSVEAIEGVMTGTDEGEAPEEEPF